MYVVVWKIPRVFCDLWSLTISQGLQITFITACAVAKAFKTLVVPINHEMHLSLSD